MKASASRSLMCICLFVLCAATHANAQVGAGALLGTVIDESGGTLSGVRILLTAETTGQSRTVLSASDGGYAVPGLAPGAYQLRAELDGFRPLLRERVQVTTGETVRVDLVLVVGAVREELDVTADGVNRRTGTQALGHAVNTPQVVALPLNGRIFVSLAALVPGVALPPGSILPRINGGRPRANEYLFDGISVLQPEPGQVAFFPNVDAIQEFSVETNSPPAEFGRFNGGVVNLTTKAGGNTVRGSAFAFVRHEALNARHPFASSTESDPRLRRHQFGGVAGGPLRRNRTFFFIDYQGQRQAIDRVMTSTVPTSLQRQGVFTEAIAGRVPIVYDPATTSGGARRPFPGQTIPLARMDPIALSVLQRYPQPTTIGTANNYRRIDAEAVDQHQFSVRLDQAFAGGRDSAFGRVTRSAERFVPATALPEGSGTTSGTLGPQRTVAWSMASSYRRVISSALFNELRLGDTRRAVTRVAASQGSLGPLPGLPVPLHWADTIPTFRIEGYEPIGSAPGTASDFDSSVTEIADSLSWLKGRHSLKMGFDLRWPRLNVLQPPSPAGVFTFSSLFTNQLGVVDTGAPLASFLLGQVETFSIDVQEARIRNRAHIQEYFVQDDWRVGERATLHAGVRYTLNLPSTEVDDRAAVYNLDTRQLDFLGQDGRPRSARRLEKANFGPRVGMVGRVTTDTTLRAGYALIWIDQSGITTPFTTPAFPFVQTVAQRTLDNLTPAFTLTSGPTVAPLPLTPAAGLGQGVFAVDRHQGSGYAQQWHASLQRQWTADLSLEVAYVGSTITRVGVPDANINQLTVAQLALGPSLLERVPNPYFGTVPAASSLGGPTISQAQLLRPYPEHTTVAFYRHNVGTTNYRGVTAKLERRLTRGLSYLVSYTRSKLVDDASAVFDASLLTGPAASYPIADAFNRSLDRDHSTGDIPHVLVGSAVWDVPAGSARRYRAPKGTRWLLHDWTATGVLRLQSGAPIAITQATNFNAFAGFGVQRPNLVGDPRLPAGGRSAARWFNTDAFATAPQFTLGSASRNPVRGPSFRNVDAALIRRVPIGGRAFLEIRAEAFNVLNTVQLGSPNGVYGSPAFGSIRSAGDPRVVQLAARVTF